MLISDFRVNCWYHFVEGEKIVPSLVKAIISNREYNNLKYTFSPYSSDSRNYESKNEWFIGYVLGEGGTSVSYRGEKIFHAVFESKYEAESYLREKLVIEIENKYAKYGDIIAGVKHEA